MAYDANSNIINATDAMGNTTHYYYDFNNRLISVVDALGYEKTTAYTKDGQISSITDGNGNETSYEYNVLGKVTKSIDALRNEVDYTYDSVGNLKEIHQYKGVTASTLSLMNDASSYTTELDEVILKYEYNSNGQLTKEINPSGTTVNYAYDKNGNLVSKEDEDGYVTTYAYDKVNNLTKIAYDSGKTVSYTYNPNNQVASMTDWLGTNTYNLDVLGRINTVTDYEGRVTGYIWNSRNQKLSMTYPDGSVVKYTYDIKGNLLKVIDGNGKETSYTYDTLDRMTREVLPNGVKTTRSYDALSRITGETSAKKDGAVIYSNAYSLDGEGNILSETKKIYENGNKLNTCITDYLYDSNNQLIQTNNSEGIVEKYFYDTLGNRVQKERTVPGNGNGNSNNKNKNKNNNGNGNNKSSTSITKYTYNNENQMLTLQGQEEEVAGHYTNGELVTFTYDQRGNVRRITTNSGTIGQYYYDDTNKMTYSINKMGIKSAYTYDGAGRRVKETLEHSNINVPEKASIHVQPPIEDLLDSNQNITLDVKKEINYVIDSTTFDNRVLMIYGMHTKTQRYTYGNGIIGLDSWNDKATDWENINQNKHDEQLYYVKDFRGSVLALTDYKCKITTTYSYNAFGTPTEKNHVNDQGIRSNIYHYAGYIYDYTTSLYFVNARYYMPETGRFMAEDIYRGDGLNRYVYVRNNPLVYVDPTGLCGEGDGNNVLDATGNVLLGVLSALTRNVSMSLADMFGIACSVLGERVALFIYDNISGGGNNIEGILERLSTDKVAYYYGKTFTDIVLIGVGLFGIVGGVGITGVGAGGTVGGLIAALPSGFTSLVISAEGIATMAAGVVITGSSLALAANAFGDYKDDLKSLQAAIDDAKSGSGSNNKGSPKTVDDFLSSNVPKQFQTQVKNAFGSDAKVTTLTQDTTVYRYYGGDSAPSSYWVTPNKVSNPISELALPPGNTAQYVDTIVLKKGTTVLEGTVAPNFGQAGGGYQYYIPGMK